MLGRRSTTAQTIILRRLLSTGLCLAATLAFPVIAQDKPGSGAAAAQMETLVLRVNLNTENKGDLFVQRTADLDFLVKVEDLKAIGFKDPVGTVQSIDGEPHLSLRSMKGVTFELDTKALALNISAEPQLLPASTITLQSGGRSGTRIGGGNSAFLNYALTGTAGSQGASSGLGVAGEAGIRVGDLLFLSDATTTDTAGRKRLVRLTSSATRDDPANLRRVVVGDFLTQSRDFSSSVNLGGISVTKLYGLDPSFVRFPTQSLTGTVALPSDMEVYLDGQRIRTERLRPGDFELRDILAFGGAQNVQVVLRDSFGRVQQLNYSLYFSDAPLRQGLHEYSYNLGAIRREFGVQSNSYGPAAFSMFHRYGLTNAFTVGWHTEAARDLLNVGPTATVVLGTLGVLNLGVAGSSIAGKRGTAALASYSFQARDWSMGLFLRHDGRNYASLGDPPTITNRKIEGSASVTRRLTGDSSISLSYTALVTRADVAAAAATSAAPFNVSLLENRRATTLSYASPLPAIRGQFSASVGHAKTASGPGRVEVFLGLNFPLGRDYSAAAGVRRDQDGHTETLRLTRVQPVGEGLGYTVSADRSSATTTRTSFNGNLQYNAPTAVLRADYGHYIERGLRREDQRVSVAGAILAVGDRVALSRPVTQSYAIVKVGELPGIGVLVNNQQVTETNSHGIAVVPSLSSYGDNVLSIGSLPLEYAISGKKRNVWPALRSGAFIDFGVTKTQAFTGKLMMRAEGAPKPIEFQEIDITIEGRAQKLATGRRGEFYVENLKPGIYPAVVSTGAERCAFDLNIPKSDEIFVDLGEFICLPSPSRSPN